MATKHENENDPERPTFVAEETKMTAEQLKRERMAYDLGYARGQADAMADTIRTIACEVRRAITKED